MNVIITAATGYGADKVSVFLDSVARCCTDTKVYIIQHERDLPVFRELSARYPFVERVVFARRGKISRRFRYLMARLSGIVTKPYRGSTPADIARVLRYLHIAVARFPLALALLERLGPGVGKVMLADSRDVVLQSDPFAGIKDSLVTGLEPRTIGTCTKYNAKWICTIYGKAGLAGLTDKSVICSGVTLGPCDRIMEYLRAMCDEIWKNLPRLRIFPFYDQALHNHLLHLDGFPAQLAANDGGFLVTLHHQDPGTFVLDRVHGRLLIGDTCPAIVHQYDRHPVLVDFFVHNPGR